ncbi:MAG TPA: flagellar basal body rod protein FlgF, partial [Nevskiaceae bacterium]|nr:flagellar basal body rod protein FlgF [Nevskiaceae bacterium]
MDHALYVAMTGANQLLQAQTVNNANLANINTVGFRAELAAQTAVPIAGPGLPSRVDAALAPGGFSNAEGSLQSTGNPLDVAVQGNHWIAVQTPDGTTAYTRAGNLHLTANGQLVNGAGRAVLDQSGSPLAVPPSASITIGGDGTVSVVPLGQTPNTVAQVGRIEVVTATPQQLVRGTDGLFHAADPNNPPLPVAGHVLITGALESSNVNPAEALVQMIQLSRQFELQTKLMQTVDQNGQSSTS